MNLEQFTREIPRPSVILITGRRGSGKDVTAVAIAETIKTQTGKEVYSNYDPQRFKMPQGWKLRGELKDENSFNPKTIQLISDAHLEYFSREWNKDINSALIRVVSVSRHRDIDFIYTTQSSGLLDKQAVSQVDAIIFKEPSALAERFERPEINDLTTEAAAYFSAKELKVDCSDSYRTVDSEHSQQWKWEHAYAYTHEGPYKIEGIKKPAWFTEDMSKIFGAQTTKPFWERIF